MVDLPIRVLRRRGRVTDADEGARMADAARTLDADWRRERVRLLAQRICQRSLLPPEERCTDGGSHIYDVDEEVSPLPFCVCCYQFRHAP
jgi:hypothetical protein